MTKEIMKTAKELAWKAYQQYCSLEQVEMRERFENWWSDNYDNRDTTKFTPEHNVYVEGRKYIQAE